MAVAIFFSIQLKAHIATAHQEIQMSCMHCPQIYSSQSQLKHHYEVDHQLSFCNTCQTPFNPEDLWLGQLTHQHPSNLPNSSNLYTFNECSKCFQYRTEKGTQVGQQPSPNPQQNYLENSSFPSSFLINGQQTSADSDSTPSISLTSNIIPRSNVTTNLSCESIPGSQTVIYPSKHPHNRQPQTVPSQLCKCGSCGRQFTDVSQLKLHISQKHAYEAAKPTMTALASAFAVSHNPTTNTSFSGKNIMQMMPDTQQYNACPIQQPYPKQHTSTKHKHLNERWNQLDPPKPVSLKCKTCRMRFSVTEEFIGHLKHCKPDEDKTYVIRCGQCNALCAGTREYLQHRHAVHDKRKTRPFQQPNIVSKFTKQSHQAVNTRMQIRESIEPSISVTSHHNNKFDDLYDFGDMNSVFEPSSASGVLGSPVSHQTGMQTHQLNQQVPLSGLSDASGGSSIPYDFQTELLSCESVGVGSSASLNVSTVCVNSVTPVNFNGLAQPLSPTSLVGSVNGSNNVNLNTLPLSGYYEIDQRPSQCMFPEYF